MYGAHTKIPAARHGVPPGLRLGPSQMVLGIMHIFMHVLSSWAVAGSLQFVSSDACNLRLLASSFCMGSTRLDEIHHGILQYAPRLHVKILA